MFRRASAVTAVLVAVAIVASGCAGTPAPVETTAAPITEEEAFAAAEETYRAYVDALNQVDLSDPETFEPVYDFTTGQARTDERESLTQMHADGWVRSGSTLVRGFFADSDVWASSGAISALACVDVSEASVADATGVLQTSPDRPDNLALQLGFEESGGALKISSSIAVEDPRCTS